MSDLQFSVSWEAYQTNICNGLISLQRSGKFVDMTIAADGHHVKVHQMVMSLVSPYIQDLINSAACPHPVIFFNKISYQTLQSILQYAYTGEAMVPVEEINTFLDACKELHIRGVENVNAFDHEIEDHGSNVTDAFNNTTNIDTNTSQDKQQDHLISDNDDNLTNMSDDCPARSDNDEKCSDVATQNNQVKPHHSPEIKNSASDKMKDMLNKSIQLQYSVSTHGKLQLICNRYVYFLTSARKTGERMWRCVTYRDRCSCRAFLVTKDNKIIRRVGVHNHPFHDKQILKRLNNGNIFSALNDVKTHIDSLKCKPNADTGEAAAKYSDTNTAVCPSDDSSS